MAVQFTGLIKCKAGCTCSKHTPPRVKVSFATIVINRSRQERRGNVHTRQCPGCNANTAAGERHLKGCVFDAG